jgi:ferric-dicitrate binding protein FerR (iron transport regulator)
MKPGENNHEEDLKKAERIAYLIAGHIKDSLTPAEQDELDDWVSASDENLELFETLTDEDNIEAGVQQYLQIEKEKAAALVRLKEKAGLSPKRKSILKKIAPYLAAASVILIAASIYFIKTGAWNKNIEKPFAENNYKDIAPGSDKAVLTLPNGRTIILDEAKNGLVTEDDGVIVTKQDGGELSYHSSDAAGLAFHTLSIPRGGKFTLKLPDGTMIWLNAESSLRYPTSFNGESRNVELDGEAYFEVTPNAKAPFMVTYKTPNNNNGTVKVLGTHFNVNTYGDDGAVVTTLLEGSVQVTGNGQSKLLKPGQQALCSSDIEGVTTNTSEAVAWKDGKFLFRDATIHTIGEQIKRWYDIDVAYEGNITQHFNAEMSRDLPLSKLLDGLEGTMEVNFELKEKKLIIKP